jgi:hypothetical protein
LDLYNRFVDNGVGKRAPINGTGDPLSVGFYLTVAPIYVDLLTSLPEFRTLTLEQLFKRLPKRYHQCVPPIGENLNIREAAYEREVRMARAVIIGLLATPEQIDRHKPQMFLDHLR